MLDVVHRPPAALGLEGTRWKLASISAAVSWLTGRSLSGVWRVLRRLKVVGKRGRDYLHSPDPNYAEKLADVWRCLEQARGSDGAVVMLFGDELTFYRQPSLARDYDAQGRRGQPLARRSLGRELSGREAGVIDALTGQVVHCQASAISVATEVKLLAQVREAFPEAERIYLAEDNWPLHFHPDVLAALEPQQTRFPLPVPPSWPNEASRTAKRLKLPIQIVPLPTYAPWTNPMEKVWRLLKQEYLHLHRKADEWKDLKRGVAHFLDQYSHPSPALLRYVGLTPQSKLYGAVLALPPADGCGI